MPQDPNLYGQRPSKKQKRDGALSTSLDFTAQLTSLMSNSTGASSSATAAKARLPKEKKDDLFRSGKSRRKDESLKEDGERQGDSAKLVLKDVHGTEDEAAERARARRRMEDKARKYAAMKRGDYVPRDNETAPLVDFDRKWAEGKEGGRQGEDTSSGDDSSEEDPDADVPTDFEDEFGRSRRITRAEKTRLERRVRRGLLGAEDVERMSARPRAPKNIIHGDAIQSLAFAADDASKMAELASKRDRSATPPPEVHYDADWEVRTKGVGFYKFGKEEGEREEAMKGLDEERKRTEGERREREEAKEKRRREIEERRKEMAMRRAKKQADSFFDEMGQGED